MTAKVPTWTVVIVSGLIGAAVNWYFDSFVLGMATFVVAVTFAPRV